MPNDAVSRSSSSSSPSSPASDIPNDAASSSASPSRFSDIWNYLWIPLLISYSKEVTVAKAQSTILLPSQLGPDSPRCIAPKPKLNYRPVIGILSHPGDGASGRLSNATNASYIAASYVKFVESAGARVIPLIYNEPPEILFEKLDLVNGVLFTGGWAKTGLYYKVVEAIFKNLVQEEVPLPAKLKEGDKCTKFFHQVANSNRRNNAIDSLLIDGRLSSNQAEISNHIGQFYQKLYSEQCSWRLRVDGLSFDSILEAEAERLEREFTEEEVRKVVKSMVGNKAPGPDGFSMAFFQACWEVLRVDILKVFNEFHARGKFELSLNTSFITLIPKTPSANNLKDFRPISLVGGSTK